MGNLQYDLSAKTTISTKSIHGLMTFLQKYEKKIATWSTSDQKQNDFHTHLGSIFTELWGVPACNPLDPTYTKPEWDYEIEDELVIKSMAIGGNIKLILLGDESYISLTKEDVIAMAQYFELTENDLLE